jgi:adenine-specific DNA-methyltransferase
VPAAPKLQYSYSPRLDPRLRFDPTAAPDKLPELLEKAKWEPLTGEEAQILGEALRRHDPWLEWAGKREATTLTVDPVALHIHERASAQAILKVAARKDVTRDLFADPQLDYHQAVQFYQHEMDWANRLILGDSLQVMASLAARESLAGRVQMVYIDPPYGIKFGSNFQTEVGQRDVKDREKDLTREPEMIKAYRDTWALGTHTYLAYLRDRIEMAKKLLSDSGSIFVQISDENLHRVRCVLDEVFGKRNFISQITDFLLWFGKNRDRTKFQSIFSEKRPGDEGATGYTRAERPSGEKHRLPDNGVDAALSSGVAVFAGDNITSQSIGRDKGEGAASWFKVQVDGFEFTPGPKARWKTNEDGMRRLKLADRLMGGIERPFHISATSPTSP